MASSSVEEIDALNILQASLLAMRRAISALSIKPEEVLIDGTLVATFSSSFNQQATRVGLLTSNTGTRKWDRFTVTR